jgi:APA family basic amino acid/polyamine antiporter
MGKVAPNLSLMPVSGSVSAMNWINMMGLGVVATLWAYSGWTTLNLVTEEIKNPAKNLPRALILSLTGVMVLYALFNFAIYRVLPFETLDANINATPRELYMGTLTAKALLGSAGQTLVTLGMFVSMFGALNGVVLAFPRNYYAMAQDGALFRGLGKLHPTWKTPVNAQIVSAVISIGLCLLRDLNQVTSLVVFSNMLYSVLSFAAVLVFRKRFPALNRPYKAVGYPWVVYFTLVVTILLMINTLIGDPVTSLSGLIVPAIAFAIYKISNRKTQTNNVEAA